MRVYFIKNYEMGVFRFKPGQDAELWDATEVIRNKFAVPYEERKGYESQAETKTKPESRTEETPVKGKTVKKKTN